MRSDPTKHDPENHFYLKQCPCCGQGIDDRAFTDISECVMKDVLRPLYMRIVALETEIIELETEIISLRTKR